jgi:putative DNA primase/helicase
MTTPDQLSLAPQHVEILGKRGIPETAAVMMGVRSIATADELPDDCPDYWTEANEYLPGLLIPWVAQDGRTEYQIRPDNPPIDKDGRAVKYASRGRDDGYEPVLWVAKRGTEDGVRLITEGTCQTLAAAIHADDSTWVLGMVGCRGWMSEGSPVVDLSLVDGQDVVIALDADMWSNPNVWDAGELLQRALRMENASTIKFLKLPAGKKTGLDDVLGTRPEGRRGSYLGALVREAVAEKFPASRRPTKETVSVEGDGMEFFGETGLLTKQLAETIYTRFPSALSAEGEVSIYKNGVFQLDKMAFIGVVSELLGDMFRPAHRSTVEEFTAGILYNAGLILPEHTTKALLNVKNGMLDLMTGELLPHDPAHLSSVQIPVAWDSDAKCPRYEAWVAESAPGQVDDLEETVSLMLDPSQTPAKAVFLFGESKSGKSTFLRIMRSMAGEANTSAVSLHQLVDDRFAAANLYGKILNVYGDLPAAHVEDISLFKVMTGEDLIPANRKHGKQFTFTNRALFAFSANELPTVGEASQAYTNRIKPFKFPNSFAGREDPRVEARILEELPGILVRWVKAYQRLMKRGRKLETDATVMQEFALKSDRVRQFVLEACIVTPAGTGTVGPKEMTTATDITKAFAAWAESQSTKAMGRNKLIQKLLGITGVENVRDHKGRRGYNVTVKPEGEWGQFSDDPAGSSGTFGVTAETLEKSKVSEANTSLSPQVGVVGQEVPELPETAGATVVPNAKAALLALAKPVPAEALTCEDCGSTRELVPPARFWYACRNCQPGTFARG